MVTPKVFVTRKIPQPALDIISRSCEMDLWTDELPPPREVLLQRVKGCHGILTLLTDRIDEEVMDASPCLRVISNYAVGYDNIDLAAADKRRIQVGNTPGVLTETTADLAFSLLLAVARRIVEADRYTRSGEWQTWGPTLLLGQDVHHSTLGLVGFGRIGREVAKRARGFDMKVQYFDTVRNEQAETELGASFVDLETLLATSDFVSIHVPLTEATRHLIGERELRLMKPTAILVNTSRGPVVDQSALYASLRDGRIAGAGLDVFEHEPIAKNDPLLSLKNVVATPHIGSASVNTRTKMALMAAENLIEGVNCRPIPYKVNPEVDSDFRCCGLD
ncbi:MAG: D-glycerate dehydrogenase [Armatimonadetes bacterium]|nr:D-glycerate dehydrogenase [Armatimonadota bacterium]